MIVHSSKNPLILDAEKENNIDDVTDEDFESARFVIINIKLNKK